LLLRPKLLLLDKASFGLAPVVVQDIFRILRMINRGESVNVILLYGFAVALMGGIDTPWNAVFGGFMVGMLENIAGAYVVGTELKLSLAPLITVGVLVMIGPSGLSGKRLVTRV
jgi:branched-subunit amino acid ABC-type transport system permease component